NRPAFFVRKDTLIQSRFFFLFLCRRLFLFLCLERIQSQCGGRAHILKFIPHLLFLLLFFFLICNIYSGHSCSASLHSKFSSCIFQAVFGQAFLCQHRL